ncbi:isochorismate synthase DhbC [Chromobacterium haemolyticum]|uniref:isochorismate synthase DhbC n=1 Tax=Chromobacterium haemolyticum TaxID=394935 RepID=UPI000DF01494|nr:isochorismate synthase DhbC [Chromobacterium haemolyticum]
MNQTSLDPAYSGEHNLLAAYQADSAFFFASPCHTLLAEGIQQVITETDPSAAIAAALASQPDPAQAVVVGAIPFMPEQQPWLFVPRRVRRADALKQEQRSALRQPLQADCQLTPQPAPAAYCQGVSDALARIGSGALDKVVLSRTLELSAQQAIDQRQLLLNLASQNQHGYTFAVQLSADDAPRRALMGASPELLLARYGRQVITNPLAGSAARSPDPTEDRRRAEALLESGKDLYEHKLVIDAVVEALARYCRNLQVPAGPSLVSTATMWHLSTRISGELIDPTVGSFELARALHPTPAVCGFPADPARKLIREIEPFDRGFFTGMVGWCDGNGDGEWAVTIRCAEIAERTLRLFAGAGIVTGSLPESELAETAAKFRTMLRAMGLADLAEAA